MPQPPWHQGPALLGGGDAGAGGRLQTQAKPHSPAHRSPLLCSRFLAGHGPVPVHGPGVGDPRHSGRRTNYSHLLNFKEKSTAGHIGFAEQGEGFGFYSKQEKRLLRGFQAGQ